MTVCLHRRKNQGRPTQYYTRRYDLDGKRNIQLSRTGNT